MKSHFLIRIRIISAAILLFAALLLFRLYFVQIVYGDEFANRADRQYMRPSGQLYDRGSIFFEDKDGRLVSAATLRSGFTIAINPGEIIDPEAVYAQLSAIEPELSRDDFIARAGKKGDPYEEILREVEEAKARQIELLDIPGVQLYKERWRFYPGGTLAAQTVGFVGYAGTERVGQYGLERFYEDTLSREHNGAYVNFFAEIFADAESVLFEGKERGGDIVTTIEPSVQLFLERETAAVGEAWGAKRTAAVIMNPKTGEIYAMAVHPTFDVNAFNEEEDPAVFVNPLVEGVYEMGSIIKPLTMAAGLDSGAVTRQTTYHDAGKITLDGYTISNFDGVGRGTVPMQEVLSQSLNTGVAFVVEQMGKKTFRKYMEAFAIGEETGIDLPNEAQGQIDNILESPRDIEYATASFGQGIAMTPMATVRALSALGNGGVLVTPHVVKEIKYDTGLSKTVSYHDGERVIAPETSEEISRMLVEVVDTSLAGGTVKLERYSVAAKTGTAQIANPHGGGYYDDRFLHSFFGYFPAYDPEFLIFFLTLEPRGVRYASETLTTPFMDTVKFLVNYYEVPPDR